MKEKPNYYAIIPSEIRYNKDLKANEKLLYGEIAALVNEKGYCSVTNKYFGDLFDLKKSTISKHIKKLEKQGYIKIEQSNKNDILEKIKNKNLEGEGIGNKKCDWCKINTVVLEKHHYPIPKSKGGKQTVNICSNCHREFHSLERKIKIKNIKEINLIKKELYRGDYTANI